MLIEETEALARVEEIAAMLPAARSADPRRRRPVGEPGHAHWGTSVEATALRYPGDIWHYRAHADDRRRAGERASTRSTGLSRTSATRTATAARRTGASTLGCVGKWAIHPSQIEIANDVFSPTADEVRRAKSIIEKVRAAEAEGQGAASNNGVMVDAATARIFELVLERAERTGRL